MSPPPARPIALLHGYLLDGSGSNLWTQAVARSLARVGQEVHLVCQEAHPEAFDFVTEARSYPLGSTRAEVLFERETPYPGRCVLHRPELGDTLPVYVSDRYERFSRVVPMVELPDHEIEAYVARNTEILAALVDEADVAAIHVNHAVLMSVVARRVAVPRGIPYSIMPHGSALEYAVKPDPRFRAMARDALAHAASVFVIGDEIARRLRDVFPDLDGLDESMIELPLGVDVGIFTPLERERRGEAAAGLVASLEGLERGRRPEQRRVMEDGLAGAREPHDLEALWTVASEYAGKSPDAELEAAVGAVDWAGDDVVLYVGRLIAAKGVQYVLAALPTVLQARPRARLVLVGHGPLREPLESLVWALEHRDAPLVRRIVDAASLVEDGHGDAGLIAVSAWLDALEARGELDAYLDAAADARLSERVLFTGYLTHERLRFLYSVADVAVFPSQVREAGPLVFLEAMASGAFPLGTYFGGMAASIDAAGESLPGDAVERMKLRTPDAEEGGIVADIAHGIVATLEDDASYGERLRSHVERRHDWRAIAARLRDTLLA